MIRIVSIGAVLVLVLSSLSAAQTAERPAVRDLGAELTCAPEGVLVPPAQAMRVSGGPEPGREMFSPGDAVLLNAGTSQGVKPGQVYRARRVIPDRFIAPISGGLQPMSIHTSGWLRVVDAQADVAYATITRACDSVETGDFIEPLTIPDMPVTAAEGEPDFTTPGRLMLGAERRQMGGAGSMMVLDRGTDHGVKPGQRLTVFRVTVGGAGPVHRIAEATALVVNAETALIRIDSSRDAVYVGDLVAMHR